MARIAFVVTTCHEFEGVKVLSSVLKQHGHETDCFVTAEEPDFHATVQRFRPDVLGIYATTGQENWAREHVERWRRELGHLKVVMGGPHPSFDPQVLLEDGYLDAITKGEAEHAMLDLVNAWEAGRPRTSTSSTSTPSCAPSASCRCTRAAGARTTAPTAQCR
jgi:radical SAM superfamily enzyme YgiQ (UPF0313 family)